MSDERIAPARKQPTREEAIAIFKGGLGKALRDVAGQYALPICWFKNEAGKHIISGNGTGFILDAGSGPFLVTTEHVFSAYAAALRQADHACMVGPLRIPLEQRIIDSDTPYDVATFSLRDEEIPLFQKGGKIPLVGSQKWPPNPPELERGVLLVGFPGDGREMRRYKGRSLVEVDWLGLVMLTVASSVSVTGITLHLEAEHEADIGLEPKWPDDKDWGGCSGGPLLTFYETRGLFTWGLGGIVVEARPPLIRASRADCLNPDGTINPYPDPMAYLRERN